RAHPRITELGASERQQITAAFPAPIVRGKRRARAAGEATARNEADRPDHPPVPGAAAPPGGVERREGIDPSVSIRQWCTRVREQLCALTDETSRKDSGKARRAPN